MGFWRWFVDVLINKQTNMAKSKNNDEAILKRARKRWTEGLDAQQENRLRGIESLKFKVGDQWPEEVKKERKDRPMLTINKLPQYVRGIVNEFRLQRPGIKVKGAADNADARTAKVYEGLIRNIENQSNFETIVDDSLEKVVDCGYGGWRILTDFESDTSFNQEIRIKRIKNQYNIISDPNAQEFDKSDKKWCFIGDMVTWDELKREYGDDVKYSSFSQIPTGTQYEGWHTEDKARIAEYYELHPDKKTIALLADGKVITVPKQSGKDKINEKEYLQVFAQTAGVTIVKTRVVDSFKVMWYKITGTDVLDRRELKGQYIPVVECFGDVTIVDGKEVQNGLIEFSKDPMRMSNYSFSAYVEGMGIQNKAPYIAAAEQVDDYRDDWLNANKKNYAVLRYKHIGGVPAPQRQQPPTGSQGFAGLYQMTSDALSETTGIYAPNLGRPSNETSGVAINERKEQGQIGTFHYKDNIYRAMQFSGKIMIDLIPQIYDTKRTIRILGPDGDDEMIPINQPHPTEKVEDADGNATNEAFIYDLNVGKYDLVVEAGPSFNTRREEFVDLGMKLLQAMPQQAPMFMDKILDSVDSPGASALAERFKKLVPPEVLGDSEVQTNDQGIANQGAAPAMQGIAQPGMPQAAPQGMQPGMPPNGVV